MGENEIDRKFDRQLEEEDAEEEFLLQQKMEELELNSESETESEAVIEIRGC